MYKDILHATFSDKKNSKEKRNKQSINEINVSFCICMWSICELIEQFPSSRCDTLYDKIL